MTRHLMSHSLNNLLPPQPPGMAGSQIPIPTIDLLLAPTIRGMSRKEIDCQREAQSAILMAAAERGFERLQWVRLALA